MTDDQFSVFMAAIGRIADAAEKQAEACARGNESAVNANEAIIAKEKVAEESHAAVRDRTLLEIEMLTEKRERLKDSYKKVASGT